MEEIQTETSFESKATNLYDAALEGNVPSLLNLLQEDPRILDRWSISKCGNFAQTPLHVAINLGHQEFAREILRKKPELAEEIDQSKRWSPLHTASAKGHLEIVKDLLAVSPNMCLVSDHEGRNPVHVAAIRGHVYVLAELVRAMPQAARERTHAGETVLHLCAKHSQPNALTLLVSFLDDGKLLNSRDSNGNTVLHLAVAAKQYEVVTFLLANKRMEINAINKNGYTAMDTYNHRKKSMNDNVIWRAMRRSPAMTAREALEPLHTQHRRILNSNHGIHNRYQPTRRSMARQQRWTQRRYSSNGRF